MKTLIYKLKRFFCKTPIRQNCDCQNNYTVIDESPLYSYDSFFSKYPTSFHGFIYQKKCNLCGREWWDNYR